MKSVVFHLKLQGRIFKMVNGADTDRIWTVLCSIILFIQINGIRGKNELFNTPLSERLENMTIKKRSSNE